MSGSNLSLGTRLLITLSSALLVALLAYLLLAEPFAPARTVLTAEFGRAGQGLTDMSPVKMRGVDVGKVERVDLNGGGRAVVTLHIDPGHRVPDTVTAAIKPASVFGPKYVDLVPGAHEATGPYLAGGARITRTAEASDLNDLLGAANGTLAAIDPGEAGIIVRTLAQGLEGQGHRLGRTLDQTGVIVDVAYRNRAYARRFLADGANLVTALSGSGPAITGIAGDTSLVIEAAAGDPDRLGSFGDQLAILSAFVAHGFDKRGGQIGAAFRSGERATAVIHAQLGLVGGTVRAANSILPMYEGLSALPGPQGRRSLGAQAYLPTDPCELILGLCPAGGR